MLKIESVIIIITVITLSLIGSQNIFAQDGKDDLRDKIEKIKLENYFQ